MVAEDMLVFSSELGELQNFTGVGTERRVDLAGSLFSLSVDKIQSELDSDLFRSGAVLLRSTGWFGTTARKEITLGFQGQGLHTHLLVWHDSNHNRTIFFGHLLAKLGITIQDRVAAWTRFRKCFPQLLHDPWAGRVFRDIEMDDLASTMFDNEDWSPNDSA